MKNDSEPNYLVYFQNDEKSTFNRGRVITCEIQHKCLARSSKLLYSNTFETLIFDNSLIRCCNRSNMFSSNSVINTIRLYRLIYGFAEKKENLSLVWLQKSFARSFKRVFPRRQQSCARKNVESTIETDCEVFLIFWSIRFVLSCYFNCININSYQTLPCSILGLRDGKKWSPARANQIFNFFQIWQISDFLVDITFLIFGTHRKLQCSFRYVPNSLQKRKNIFN